jgi:hypothetical protein
MKVKLLKKLRKRYDWYFNKNKFPVLIDHKKRSVTIYDLDYLMNRLSYTEESIKQRVQVEHDEWALRWLKTDLLKDYGWDIKRTWYRQAVTKLKHKIAK